MRRRRIILPLKRQRLGKTDYRQRFRLLRSGETRLVIRKSLRHISAQLIAYEPKGDKVLTAAHSRELKKYGVEKCGRNVTVAYLVGYLLGKKAHTKNIKTAVLDLGLAPSTKGSTLYAVLQGALDAGINIPHAPEILPKGERIQGKHLKNKLSLDQAMKAIQGAFPL